MTTQFVYIFYNAVFDNGLSGNQAIIMHRIPLSKLKDHLSGSVTHGDKPGPKPYLNVEELVLI